MSTLRVTEIQSNSTAFNTPVRFETSGGTENGQLAKAWVNFNGQGTVGIRRDFNVNTITDNGTGDYTVNFSNAMSDANFIAVTMASDGVNVNNRYYRGGKVRNQTTSSTRMITGFAQEGLGNFAQDMDYMHTSVFS